MTIQLKLSHWLGDDRPTPMVQTMDALDFADMPRKVTDAAADLDLILRCAGQRVHVLNHRRRAVVA